MIPIRRASLPAALQSRLASKTDEIAGLAESDRTKKARESWRNSSGSRASLRTTLESMSVGRDLCMYCSDGRGTSVDHYEPIDKNSLRVWDWDNHILACSVCNSHAKRADFPSNLDNKPLYLDPTRDDPSSHLLLTPSTGDYEGLTDRGVYTAEILLNAELLARGRRAAWLDALDLVRKYDTAVATGDDRAARVAQFRLLQRPNLDAFYAMLQIEKSGNVAILLPSDVRKNIAKSREQLWSWIGLVIS